MKLHLNILLMFLTCMFISGCVFVDDNCHYETYCNYICDEFGHHCIADTCWDEWICRDDYHYRTRE